MTITRLPSKIWANVNPLFVLLLFLLCFFLSFETCYTSGLMFSPRSWGVSTKGWPSHLATWSKPQYKEHMGNLVVDVGLNSILVSVVVVKPERLAVDQKVRRGRTRWFQPTPMGGRQCLGSHHRPPLCLRSALKNHPCICLVRSWIARMVKHAVTCRGRPASWLFSNERKSTFILSKKKR